MSIIPIGRAVKIVVDTAARRKQVIDMHRSAAEMHEALADAVTLSADLKDFSKYARHATDPGIKAEWLQEVEQVRREYLAAMIVVGEVCRKCDVLCAELGLPHPMAAITAKESA